MLIVDAKMEQKKETWSYHIFKDYVCVNVAVIRITERVKLKEVIVDDRIFNSIIMVRFHFRIPIDSYLEDE